MKKKQKGDLQDPTPATHGDLNVWGGKLQEDIQEVRDALVKKPDKEDLRSELTRKADKADLEIWARKIMDHFDRHMEAYVENKASILLGVKHDEVREIQRKAKDHEERITVLER